MPHSDTKATVVYLTTPLTKLGRIFAVTELFEHVLAYLPIQDLLLAQRVCKKWKAACREQFEHNSLLEARFEPFIHNLSLSQPRVQYRAHYDAIAWNQSPESQRAYIRAEASWRKMLILQPPPQRTAVFRKISGFRGESTERATDIDHNDFSRMGWIYDRCSEVCLGDADGCFDISWDNTLGKAESGSGAEPTLALNFHYETTCGADEYDFEPRDDRHLKSEAYSPFYFTWEFWGTNPLFD